MKRLVLLKTAKIGGEELGMLLIFDGAKCIFECVTLQKADILVDGEYPIEPYLSPKSGRNVLLIKKTPGHDFLEIHIGNYLRNTDGCVLPGRTFGDIDGDGLLDVTDSTVTMAAILTLIQAPSTLTVKTIA